MRVHYLIEMLKRLPPNTQVFTCGLEGIFKAQTGNLFPLKVLDTDFGACLYFDDGLCDNEQVTRDWMPLDEYVGMEDTPPELQS